jgi:hypothetical protein
MKTDLLAWTTYAQAVLSVVAILVATLFLLEVIGKLFAPEVEGRGLSRMIRIEALVRDVFLLLLVILDLVQAVLAISLLGPVASLSLGVRELLRVSEALATLLPLAFMIWSRIYRRAMLAQAARENAESVTT